MGAGRVVILNGTPRSGKTSIAQALNVGGEVEWRNLGVDWSRTVTPPNQQPGIGLRPGGERPDLEDAVWDLYDQLYSVVATQAANGHNVAVDVGHHCGYTGELNPWRIAQTHLSQHSVWVVGIRCDVEIVAHRRAADPEIYVSFDTEGHVAEPVQRWETAVHDPGIYDLEVDTGTASSERCAERILAHMASSRPSGALAAAAA